MLISNLDLNLVAPNADQPRKHFDQDGLRELSESIQELGLLQPIIVRDLGGLYEIVAGERRYRASIMAGMTEIPALVVEADEDQAFVLAVAENVARRDMTVIEEATAFKLLSDKGHSLEAIGKMFGKSSEFISWRMDLLNLDPMFQHLTARGQLSRNLAWYMSRLTLGGQAEVFDRYNRGEFRTDQDAVAFAVAVHDRENEIVLFEFEAPEMIEKRREVQSKVNKEMETLGRAAGALDKLLDVPVEDLAAGLGQDAEKILVELRALEAHVRNVSKHVAKADSLRKAHAS